MTLLSWFAEIKLLHISAVALSYSLFAVRGVWMLYRPERMQLRWVRTVPHVSDTILLASGITLAITLHKYPGVSPWLTAKLVGLIAYILLGMVAFRFGRARWVRTTSWIAAQIVFFYIVSVAVTEHPLPL